MEAYLDNAATTRVSDGVREIMERTMAVDFGNPSSKHRKGMEAERYLRDAAEAAESAAISCTAPISLFTYIKDTRMVSGRTRLHSLDRHT